MIKFIFEQFILVPTKVNSLATIMLCFLTPNIFISPVHSKSEHHFRHQHIRTLYKNPVPGIRLPELFRYAKLFTFKDPVEIGDIVKPAFVGYFSYRCC